MDQPGQIGPLWQMIPPDPESLNRAIESYHNTSDEERLAASRRYLADRYANLFDVGRYATQLGLDKPDSFGYTGSQQKLSPS